MNASDLPNTASVRNTPITTAPSATETPRIARRSRSLVHLIRLSPVRVVLIHGSLHRSRDVSGEVRGGGALWERDGVDVGVVGLRAVELEHTEGGAPDVADAGSDEPVRDR